MKPEVGGGAAIAVPANRSRKGAAQLKPPTDGERRRLRPPNRSRKGAAQLKRAPAGVSAFGVDGLTAPERGRHN